MNPIIVERLLTIQTIVFLQCKENFILLKGIVRYFESYIANHILRTYNCQVTPLSQNITVPSFLKNVNHDTSCSIPSYTSCSIPSYTSFSRLGPLRRRRLKWGRPRARGAERWGAERRGQNRVGSSAAARKYLGSCRLGNCTFGKLALGKIPLGSCHLGKILWEST